MVLYQRHGLGQGARPETKGTLDELGFTDAVAFENERPSLAFALGRLQRLEPAHWPGELLELAVIGPDGSI